MSLSRLLRSSVVKSALSNQLRGGHGMPRPDPPVVDAYVHKRALHIYDLNLWWFDDAGPEYVVSYQDNHLRDHWHAIQDILFFSPYYFGLFLVMGGFVFLFNTSRFIGAALGSDTDQELADHLEQRAKRDGYQRNFLGFKNTYEQGKFRFDYDRKFMNQRNIEFIQTSLNEAKAINKEAQNYINKLESEIRAKYQ